MPVFTHVISNGWKDSNIKRGGMLVVSLRSVNFGFWSHLGCFGQNAIIRSHENLLRVAPKEI